MRQLKDPLMIMENYLVTSYGSANAKLELVLTSIKLVLLQFNFNYMTNLFQIKAVFGGGWGTGLTF